MRRNAIPGFYETIPDAGAGPRRGIAPVSTIRDRLEGINLRRSSTSSRDTTQPGAERDRVLVRRAATEGRAAWVRLHPDARRPPLRARDRFVCACERSACCSWQRDGRIRAARSPSTRDGPRPRECRPDDHTRLSPRSEAARRIPRAPCAFGVPRTSRSPRRSRRRRPAGERTDASKRGRRDRIATSSANIGAVNTFRVAASERHAQAAHRVLSANRSLLDSAPSTRHEAPLFGDSAIMIPMRGRICLLWRRFPSSVSRKLLNNQTRTAPGVCRPARHYGPASPTRASTRRRAARRRSRTWLSISSPLPGARGAESWNDRRVPSTKKLRGRKPRGKRAPRAVSGRPPRLWLNFSAPHLDRAAPHFAPHLGRNGWNAQATPRGLTS